MMKQSDNNVRYTGKPAVRPPRLGRVPDPDIHLLGNGVPVYLFPSSDQSVVRLDLFYDAGTIGGRKPLQARFTGIMLPGGTASKSAREIDESFDFLGSFPNFGVERDKASIQMYILPAAFREAVSLLHDVIYNPVFPVQELQMQRENRLQKLLINRKRVSYLSLEAIFESLFGSSHPYGRKTLPEDYMQIDRDDLIAFHERHYRPGLMRIAIAGHVDREIINTVESLFGNAKACAMQPDFPPLPGRSNSGHKVFIEVADAVQNSIRIGRRIVGMKHSDYPGLKVTDTLLGGYFGSRLMRNLREEKGYTYGISSSLNSFMLSGVEIISAEVGSEYTNDSLREIYHEMDLLRTTKPTASELRLVRNSMLGDLLRQFDGPFLTCESIMAAVDAGLSREYYLMLEDRIKSATPDEIKRLAETYYNPEEFDEVIAGRRI
jgi:predicted Zn-dependent peptidase